MASRRRIGPWLSVAGALLVLAALLWFGDVGSVLDALSGLSLLRLAAALGLVTVAYALRFGKWHLLVRRLGLPVGPRRSLQVFLSGLMMSVTPAKVGELWKSVLLAQDGIPVGRSLPAVAVERLVDFAAIALLAALGIALVWGLWWVFPLAVVGVVAVGVVLRWRSLWTRLVTWLGRRPRLARPAEFLGTVAEGAHGILAPATVLPALALGIMAWALEGVALGAILEGLGADVSWAVAVAAFCAGTLAGVVSLLPGGLGTTEAGMVGLLVARGVHQDVAVAATLLGRACTLGYGALVGAVVSLLWPAAAKDGGVVDAERAGDALEPALDGPGDGQ
jgi:glycosyltransferase 2 family protein